MLTNKNPIFAKRWNYDKNRSLTPLDVTLMSNKLVWWICDKGHHGRIIFLQERVVAIVARFVFQESNSK